jgi:hypothetical protein
VRRAWTIVERTVGSLELNRSAPLDAQDRGGEAPATGFAQERVR